MYTQCPDCATVFRVTAEALRAAQGDVRCGVCSTSFNALENLSEVAVGQSDAETGSPSPDDSIEVEEFPGGEEIELSSANEIPALTESATPADEEKAMEFHGDAADLDRLFVVATATEKPFNPAKVAASLTLGDLDRTDEHPILVIDERDEPEAPAATARSATHEPAQEHFTSPRILIPEEMRKRLAEQAAARTALATDFGENDGSSPQGRQWAWVAGAAALSLLLAVQVVHSARESLIKKPGVGPLLAQVYAFFGAAVTSPTDLAAYELRQWGAASDPTQAGRLLLRASIVNRAGYAQPYPLLRLALQDRFGATLGIRDVEPADYVPGTGVPSLLDPGQRVDAEIRIVDPGKDAVGFEMDVCLQVAGGIHCANEITTASQ